MKSTATRRPKLEVITLRSEPLVLVLAPERAVVGALVDIEDVGDLVCR